MKYKRKRKKNKVNADEYRTFNKLLTELQYGTHFRCVVLGIQTLLANGTKAKR